MDLLLYMLGSSLMTILSRMNVAPTRCLMQLLDKTQSTIPNSRKAMTFKMLFRSHFVV